MAGKSSLLTGWWQNSLLYSLMAGSFFLGWLVGVDDYRKIDYRSTSRTVAVTERIIRPILRGLYRLGDGFRSWLSGSVLVRRWLLLAGLLVVLMAVVVLRLTLSPGLAAGVALVGLGMILTPNLDTLRDGSWLGRLTTWWLDD